MKKIQTGFTWSSSCFFFKLGCYIWYSQYLFFRNIGLPQHLTFPSTMIAILSPRASASSMECVVNRIVRPSRYFLSTSHVTFLACGSKPVVGSSRIIIWKKFSWVLSTLERVSCSWGEMYYRSAIRQLSFIYGEMH